MDRNFRTLARPDMSWFSQAVKKATGAHQRDADRKWRAVQMDAAAQQVAAAGGTEAQIQSARDGVYADMTARMRNMAQRKLEANFARHGTTVGTAVTGIGTLVAAVYPPVGAAIVAAGAGCSAISIEQQSNMASRDGNKAGLMNLLSSAAHQNAISGDGVTGAREILEARKAEYEEAKRIPLDRQSIGHYHSMMVQAERDFNTARTAQERPGQSGEVAMSGAVTGTKSGTPVNPRELPLANRIQEWFAKGDDGKGFISHILSWFTYQDNPAAKEPERG